VTSTPIYNRILLAMRECHGLYFCSKLFPVCCQPGPFPNKRSLTGALREHFKLLWRQCTTAPCRFTLCCLSHVACSMERIENQPPMDRNSASMHSISRRLVDCYCGCLFRYIQFNRMDLLSSERTQFKKKAVASANSWSVRVLSSSNCTTESISHSVCKRQSKVSCPR
jgi:hypothetical protein